MRMKVNLGRLRWLLPAALSTTLFGCPNQELAPLSPCTVSGVSVEVPQSGVDKVDLLFMIDNSGSMSEEQAKLADVLDDMVLVLTTGQLQPSMPKEKPDFPPVQSLHIGVVSSDMGVNGAPPQKSCGALSFKPDERDTFGATEFLVKPLGDDGVLQTSTLVATNGIWAAPTSGAAPVERVPGDPSCQGIVFPAGQKYIDFQAGVTNPQDTAKRFSCISKLGKNGCGLEQQLESALKALTPPDSQIKFSGSATNGTPTSGHGDPIAMNAVPGQNRGFLRQDSILAVVFVTDEEDCSIPDGSREIFDAMSTSVPGEINVRCGLKENQGRLHPVKRYVDGLRALKPAAYQDRLIVASIVGVPTKEQIGSTTGVTSGAAAIQAILNRPDMEFKVQRNMTGLADEPVPTCISSAGAGSAAPARRFLDLTKEFGDNGVVTSICEPSYENALKVIIDKIAAQLTGACLPRKLNVDSSGKVLCDVVEIKAMNSNVPCDPNKGRIQELPSRNGRRVCLMQQVPGGTGGEGWYYDETSKEVLEQCQKNPQRIAFTGMANPDPGAQAKFECFQPVAKSVDVTTDKDEDAIGLSCREDPLNTAAPKGDAKCDAQESGRGEIDLICILGSCQQACSRQSECPDGWLCEQNPVDGRAFCINPTCPPSLN
jgi:hypothetical protein